MQPRANINNWAAYRERLEEKFREPITFEHSQDNLGNIRQRSSETIEKYGNKIRLTLFELNESSKSLSDNEEALRLLAKAKEILAIRKFEQNLMSNNVRIWVGAKTHETLDEAITYAIKKEDLYARNPICSYCRIPGHVYDECDKRRNQNSSPISRSVNTFQNNPNNPNNRSNPNNGGNHFYNLRPTVQSPFRNNGNNRTPNNQNNFNRNNNGTISNSFGRNNPNINRNNGRNGNNFGGYNYTGNRNRSNNPPNPTPRRTNKIFLKSSELSLQDIVKPNQSKSKNE